MQKVDTGSAMIHRFDGALNPAICARLCTLSHSHTQKPEGAADPAKLPWQDSDTFAFDHWEEGELRHLIGGYRLMVAQLICLAVREIVFPHFTDLVRWRPGKSMDEHKDDGYPGDHELMSCRHYSAVTYYNDDYSGGETFIAALSLALGLSDIVEMTNGAIRLAPREGPRPAPDLKTLFAGVAFVRRDPAIFGTISLDLFAVLLGGAVAMLPIYAKDILETGPFGLGILRAAPAIGALLMTVVLTRYPITHRVGMRMFQAVIANNNYPPLEGENSNTRYVQPAPEQHEIVQRYKLLYRDLVDSERPWRHDPSKLASAIQAASSGEKVSVPALVHA